MPKDSTINERQTRFKEDLPNRTQERMAIRHMTYKDFVDSVYRYGHMTRDEIQKDLQRPECTMLELMFGKVILDAAKGDDKARNTIMNRLWGAVAQKHEITGLERDKLSDISDENLIRLVRDKKGTYKDVSNQ